MSENTPATTTFDLHVVSAQAEIWSGPVHMISARSANGELGILPRHTPLLTRLLPGELRIRTPDGEEEYLYVSGGILEVQPEIVTVLADVAMRGEQVDENAALEAKARAEAEMAASVLYSDRDKAHAELLKAVAQLEALEHARRKRRKGR